MPWQTLWHTCGTGIGILLWCLKYVHRILEMNNGSPYMNISKWMDIPSWAATLLMVNMNENHWKPFDYGGTVCWHHFLWASLQMVADKKILSTASFPCKKCKDLSGHSVLGGGNKVTLASTSEEYDPWCQRWKGSLRMARNFGRTKGGRKMVKSPVEKHPQSCDGLTWVDFLVGNVVSGLSLETILRLVVICIILYPDPGKITPIPLFFKDFWIDDFPDVKNRGTSLSAAVVHGDTWGWMLILHILISLIYYIAVGGNSEKSWKSHDSWKAAVGSFSMRQNLVTSWNLNLAIRWTNTNAHI